MMVRPLVLLSAAALSASATGQTCDVPQLQKMPTTQLSTMLVKAKGANLKKDEFETTAAYQQRVAAAGAAIPGNEIKVILPLPLAPTFDADTQKVVIGPYSVPMSCSLYSSELSPELKAVIFGKPASVRYGVTLGEAFCASHVIASVDGKPYEASNSFGAKVTVIPTRETAEGIYFGYGDSGQTLIAGREKYSRNPAFTFSATPDEARSLKTNSALVFLIKPVAPFLAEGSRYIEPKIASPIEITTKTSYLVAEARCIGVVDRVTGKVFAASTMAGGM